MNLPKVKFNLTDLDKKADEVFPSAILTLISIIQGVSFYILADNTSKLIEKGKPIASVLLYSILSLTDLVIVAFEYIWFVGLFTGMISVFDISFVFLLGVGQVVPMYFLDNPCSWWFFHFCFCIIGVGAFMNSTWKAGSIEYKPEVLTQLLKSTLARNRWISVAAAVISMGAYVLIVREVYPSGTPLVGAGIMMVLALYLFYRDHRFLKQVRQACLKEEPQRNPSKDETMSSPNKRRVKILQRQAWLAFFVEINTEIRARRVAEYTYTAAAVAAFGALAWGVAALNSQSNKETPAIAAVVATIIIVIAVFLKIMNEHFKHFKRCQESIRLAREISDAYEITDEQMPSDFRGPVKPGTGHTYSVIVLEVGGLGAILFSLSIAFPDILIRAGIIGIFVILFSVLLIIILDKIKSSAAPAQKVK